MNEEASDPEISSVPAIGVIGLGGSGCIWLNQMNFPQHWNVKTALWDCDQSSLDQWTPTSGMEIKCLGSGLVHGLGSGGHAEMGAAVFLMEQDACSAWMEGLDWLILLLSTAGGFGAGFAPEMARLAQAKGLRVMVHGMLPFSFEGKRRRDQAMKTIELLRNRVQGLWIREADDYLGHVPDTGSAVPALATIGKQIATTVSDWLRLLNQKGAWTFDARTLEAAFEGKPEKWQLWECHADGPEAEALVLKQVDLALRAKQPDPPVPATRMIFTAVTGTDWTPAELQTLFHAISARGIKASKSFFACTHDAALSGIRLCLYQIHLPSREVIDLAQLAQDEPLKPAPKLNVRRHDPKSSHKKKKSAKQPSVPASLEQQGLFDAILNQSNRGYFDETSQNHWNGVDLDIPTYLRRGLRVKS
jgi:cell division protein FtsZ